MSAIDLNIKGDVEVLRLQPGDKLVVHLETKHWRDGVIDDLRAGFEKHFPGHEVVFLSGDISLSVAREEIAA